MKKLMLPLCLSFFALVLISGCESQTSSSDSPVIATVNKTKVTEDDFIKAIGKVPEWAREKFTTNEGKEQFLEELIKRELVYAHAKEMKLHKSEEYLEKAKEFEEMTLVQLVLKKEVEEKAKVDEAEAQAFFNQNADKLTVGAQIKASHILVATEEEAKSVYDRIKNGENFENLARSLSKDTGSASKGGDLGYFARGKMVPEFERAVLQLKPGEVSNPVRTRFGFHVIKLADIKKGTPATYEQSKTSLMRQLTSEKQKKLFESFVDGLKGSSNVTKNTEALTQIKLPWEQAGSAQPPQ